MTVNTKSNHKRRDIDFSEACKRLRENEFHQFKPRSGESSGNSQLPKVIEKIYDISDVITKKK